MKITIAHVFINSRIGWTEKMCEVTNPSKINGVEVANIAKVMGAAISTPTHETFNVTDGGGEDFKVLK